MRSEPILPREISVALPRSSTLDQSSNPPIPIPSPPSCSTMTSILPRQRTTCPSHYTSASPAPSRSYSSSSAPPRPSHSTSTPPPGSPPRRRPTQTRTTRTAPRPPMTRRRRLSPLLRRIAPPRRTVLHPSHPPWTIATRRSTTRITPANVG